MSNFPTISVNLDDDLSTSSKPVYQNTNGMPLSGGKNLHMELGIGDLANRIITVGHESRGEKIASWLDTIPSPKKYTSSRGFVTITGYYHGVMISIVSIGMGPAMMDFFVRESRAIVTGPMAMIRYGTCGGLTEYANAGSIVIASQGSAYVSRNPDAFCSLYSEDVSLKPDSTILPYNLSKIVPANQDLSNLVHKSLASELGDDIIRSGINITADSFYSSQGRLDPKFHDDNSSIISLLKEEYPNACSLEMESFFLLHLALCSKELIKATAAAIVVANRPSGEVMDGALLDMLEKKGGKALLDAITQISL